MFGFLRFVAMIPVVLAFVVCSNMDTSNANSGTGSTICDQV